MTTHEELQTMMDFDSVIKVDEDGTIARADGIHCYADLNVNTQGEDEFDLSAGWELLSGFTGQYSYNGPVMHSSEFIGGGLARYILETPGYYVALFVEGRCDYDGSTYCTEDSGCDCEPTGWAIAYMPLEAI